MTLVANWRAVLTQAWSIRLILLAGLLSGAEVVLPMVDLNYLPPDVLAALAGLVSAAALVARVLAQPGVEDGE